MTIDRIIDMAEFSLALVLSITFAKVGALYAALGWGMAAMLWLKALIKGALNES